MRTSEILEDYFEDIYNQDISYDELDSKLIKAGLDDREKEIFNMEFEEVDERVAEMHEWSN